MMDDYTPRTLCSVIGCDETATTTLDGGPENGTHDLCEDHAAEAKAGDLGDFVAARCCY